MADALRETVFTLKIVGVVASILTLLSFIGLPILREYADEKTRERVTPYISSLMTISGIVAPLVWLIVYLLGETVPIIRELTNNARTLLGGTFQGGLDQALTRGFEQTAPLLQGIQQQAGPAFEEFSNLFGVGA